MEKLRIGVIGARSRQSISRPWQNSGRAIVAAGMDIRPENLDEFKAKVNPEAFVTTDAAELLSRADIDAVAIFTPDYTHEEYAVAAFEAGKHVFCEKPLAITVEGCDRILQAWRRSGKQFMVGHNMRYMADIRTMKEIIDSGAIGQVKTVWCRHFVNYGGQKYFHDWHATKGAATSLLLQKGAHDIDVIHWLAGGYSRLVTGLGGLDYYGGDKPDDLNCKTCPERDTCVEVQLDVEPPWRHMCAFRREVDIEDNQMIIMNLDNGVRAAYLQCHFTPDAGRNYTFIGTEGRVENSEESIRLFTRRSNTWREYADRTYHLKKVTGGHGGGDPAEAMDFIDLIVEGKTDIASPVAARMAVAAGIAGAKAIRNGGWPELVPELPAGIAEYELNTQRVAS